MFRPQQELQKSFAEKNLQMLQEVMNKLEPEVSRFETPTGHHW